MTTNPQHLAAMTNNRLPVEIVAGVCASLRATGLPSAVIIDVVEAGVAVWLAAERERKLFALGDAPAVTILLNGEVATDLLPHLAAQSDAMGAATEAAIRELDL